MTKRELVQLIAPLMKEYQGERDFIARISAHLNERGIPTLTGKRWTPRNLWAFSSLNAEQFAKAAPSFVDRASVPQDQMCQPGGLAGILEIGGIGELTLAKKWLEQVRRLLQVERDDSKSIVPIAIDRGVLKRVRIKLAESDTQLSEQIQELLLDWLRKKR